MNSFSIKQLLNKYGIILVLVALMVILSFLSEAFFTTRNIFNVMRQVSIIGIISIGVTLIIITEGIDLSSGSIVSIAGVGVAMLMLRGVPVPIAILSVLIISASLGLINGSLVAYGGIPPFIATLGMMIGARGISFLLTGARPISEVPDSFAFLGGGSFLGLYVPIWIYFFIALGTHVLLQRTRLGRYIFAVGANKNAARICGINVEKTKIFVYVFGSFLAGVAGLILAARIRSGNPISGLNYELDAIASTVVGGTSLTGGYGSIPMCIVGAFIIGFINNGMDLLGINPYWQQLVKAFIIVSAVLFDTMKRKQQS
ncbi:MAG: ABC transporter permease [Brevinema sp.]